MQEEKKPRFFRFFAPEGALAATLDGFSDIVMLNVLCVLCSIPVVTAGTSLAAAFRCSQRRRMGIGGSVLREFFRAWKGLFRRVTPVWVCMAALAALFSFELGITRGMAPLMGRVSRCVLTAALIILLALCVWVLPVLESLKVCRRRAVKLALALAVANLPRTLGMMLVALAPMLVATFIEGAFGVVLMLILLVLVEGIVMINSVLCAPVLRLLAE